MIMQQTRAQIDNYSLKDDKYSYYNKIIKKIEENVNDNPDISIEASKALIEGISKTIILSLDISMTHRKVESNSFPGLFKQACQLISENVEIEEDFILRTFSMIQRLSEIRNERGEISHGRSVPRLSISEKDCSLMVMNVTDSIVAYLLKAFFSIDLSFKEDIKYENNPEFNDYLDEAYFEYELGISYSKALFDQDFDSYNEQLIDYLDNKEEKQL